MEFSEIEIPRDVNENVQEYIKTLLEKQSQMALQMLPQFSSIDDERHHRLQKLVGGFKFFGQLGFNEGVAGHITVRDPEYDHYFWINPFGMDFTIIGFDDLLLVDRFFLLLISNF